MVKDFVCPCAFTGGAITQTALFHLPSLFVILALPLCLSAQQVFPVSYRLSNNGKQLPSLYGMPSIWPSSFFLRWWKWMACLLKGRSARNESTCKLTFLMWQLQLVTNFRATHEWQSSSVVTPTEAQCKSSSNKCPTFPGARKTWRVKAETGSILQRLQNLFFQLSNFAQFTLRMLITLMPKKVCHCFSSCQTKLLKADFCRKQLHCDVTTDSDDLSS